MRTEALYLNSTLVFFFSSRRRHTRCLSDWSSDVCSSDLFRKRNGHIAACSNSALELATGEWVALLDQDDLLAEHALAVVAATIVEDPKAGLIYSDEDKIDQDRKSTRLNSSHLGISYAVFC